MLRTALIARYMEDYAMEEKRPSETNNHPLDAGGPPPWAGDSQGGPQGEPPLGAGGPPPWAGDSQGGPPPEVSELPPWAIGPKGGLPEGVSGAPMAIDPTSGAKTMPAFVSAWRSDVIERNLDMAALWFIDIRNFRSINPKYGYFMGNVLLKGTATGIRQTISHDLPVARLGADRFVCVSQGMDFEDSQKAFSELVKFVNQVASENKLDAAITLAGGIYFLDDIDYQTGNHSRAIDYASVAHRNAKKTSASELVLFTDEDLQRDARRITLEQSIDTALEKGQIEVWYQPQIDYIYGDVIGAEALARWNHPELGWVYPTEFIPILENCGKIHDLDLYVWEEACRNAGRWRSIADGNPVPISVNISRLEVYEEDLLEHFLELQNKYGLPEGSLHLEVTESAFVEESERLYKVIEAIREKHLRVEMDDFGSGLSSLNMLKDVPVDVVKLDMGFLRSSMGEERGGVVLGAVIRMLQGLNTPIIAEGVETLEQAEMLKNMGCHLMQGFHFSKPMPIDEFENFIESNKAIEKDVQRTRHDARIDDLTSLNAASSYLFNHAMGATLFFYELNGKTESILVNDDFYDACGFDRMEFGNAKINPIGEIAEDSRPTLFRAASEAREFGAALAHAQIKRNGRWIDCLMRFLGTSPRGNVFSLSIYRWHDGKKKSSDDVIQIVHDRTWVLGMMEKITTCGFIRTALDDELTIDYMSPVFVESSGLSNDEFMRRYHNSLVRFITLDKRAELLDAIRASTETGGLIEHECSVYSEYDKKRPAQLYGRIQPDENGDRRLYAFVLFKDGMSDVDSSTGLNQERLIPFVYDLKKDRLEIHNIQRDGSDKVITVDNWLKIIDQKPDNITPESAAKALATVRDLRYHPTSGFADIKCNLRNRDNMSWYHVNYTCEANEDGETIAIRGYAQDASDQIGSTKWWRRQAEIDQLTSLLNRNAVEQAINLAMRTHGAGMMFMIDLDGFKRINDEFGHLSGDSLLRDVADALAHHFREGDVLGRYGGDEFVAFVPLNTGDPRQIAEQRCKDIIAAISSIETPDGKHAGCSVGVAISHNRELTFYDLLEVADQAMYKSKLAGKGVYTINDMR